MKYYPIFLDLTDKTCLVVGAGNVGIRKIRTLVQCSPAGIIVVDPYVYSIDLPDPGNIITHLREEFSPDQINRCHLVFACTGDAEINDLVLKSCREKNVWCNAAERPEQGDFILPGIFSRQDLIIAVSTCGCSPALTARIKNDLQDIYGPEYALLTELLAGIRKIILSLDLPQESNREYFRKIVESEAVSFLRTGRRQELMALMHDILPAGAHNQVQGLINALL